MGLLDMLNEPLLLRLRIVVYSILVFFSFFIFIGAAVMKDEFEGKCPLYSDYHARKDGKVSSCNYPMAIAIIFQLLYLLFRIAILLLFFMGKFNKDMFFFSDIMELVYEVVDCIAFFFTFIGACILSAGTNSACDGNVNEAYCDHLADWLSASRAAQAGAWISTFAWLFIAVVGFLTLMRAGKIPCLGGGAAASSGGAGQTAADGGQQAPPMQTPPSNPDDMPKY
ncbi:hypothetical protein PoB_006119600 [Plakobranchus ocellatus]|uniref:MARVEL domain-containing protein n=1 Tax=Plakobranchus ocellatus TaxID=259542 RepID=A0AAV4CS14_9GAST|nr:hypothetical protein PoB_006119600 [Plakobranchus ocellatus]